MKYFNYSEFDSPDVQGSGQMMDKTLLQMLDEVRDILGEPIIITSGFRTPANNEAIGGVEGSSHTLLEIGINRIGIADNFVHIDIDKDKDPNVIWTY
jgi:hypothetical protein